MFIDLCQNKVKMQYIYENFGYFYCFGEVSAIDGQNIDVFRKLEFHLRRSMSPQLSPIELQLEFQSTRPRTSTYFQSINKSVQSVLAVTFETF